MIGGYYVIVVEKLPDSGKELVGLLAGPFATWAEADKVGPAAVANVKDNPNLVNPSYGIAEFYFHRVIAGTRNAALWCKPTPTTRN